MGRPRVQLSPGDRFGRLTVIEFAGLSNPGKPTNKGRHALYRCLCDCGSEIIIPGSRIKSGKSKSCGCLLPDAIRERCDALEVNLARDRRETGVSKWSQLTPDRKAYYAQWQREYRKTPNGKRYTRAMNLKKFGITPEQYDELHKKQKGLCASCGRPETKPANQFGKPRLAVDHCHKSNIVRGLLCMKCNRALGLLDDDPEIVERLLRYRMKSL